MEFVVFLAAYMVRRKLDNSNLFAADTFWRNSFSHAHSVAPVREASLVRGIVIIAVPTLLFIVGEMFVRKAGWSLAIHPFGFVLLFLLMGTPGLGAMLDVYIDAWRKGDMLSAWHHVCDFLPPADRGAASSPEQMHLALSRTVIGMIFERYFVIAFWYVVAGLGGAFAARALIALRDHWPHAAARTGFGRAVNALNYLPSRLLGLTFGIAGDLAGWLKGGKSALLSLDTNAWQTLMKVADSSLTGYELEPERFSRLDAQDWPDFGDRSLAAIRGLMNRSMLVWICALALLVISGIV